MVAEGGYPVKAALLTSLRDFSREYASFIHYITGQMQVDIQQRVDWQNMYLGGPSYSHEDGPEHLVIREFGTEEPDYWADDPFPEPPEPWRGVGRVQYDINMARLLAYDWSDDSDSD